MYRQIRFSFILSTVLIVSSVFHLSANPDVSILSMRDRAKFIDNITEQRVKQLLPNLMAETGIDMWILVSREYNEDPVLKTLLPAQWLGARRTTILVFANNIDNNQMNAYAIAPYNVGDIFKSAWDKKTQPDQWQALAELIEQYEPKKIGINQSSHWAHADGLVASDKQKLVARLPKKYQERLVSAQSLAVGWLEQRIPDEVTTYQDIVAIAHAIIAEGFSSKVIQVGQTTTDDLTWWFREKARELKLQVWFHPSISIQRNDSKGNDHGGSSTAHTNNIILPGDLLHIDFGITYLRLNTDTQQHAYVLRKGEVKAPDFINKAFASANQLQDIFTAEFSKGRTGNQVLKSSREKAIAQGLKPTIYTHPLGYHGHGAGTTLGMWDSQQGVIGSGDYPLHVNTAYAIELNNAVYLDQWQKEIRIMLEEDAFFDESGVWYLDGRQTELILIDSN